MNKKKCVSILINSALIGSIHFTIPTKASELELSNNEDAASAQALGAIVPYHVSVKTTSYFR